MKSTLGWISAMRRFAFDLPNLASWPPVANNDDTKLVSGLKGRRKGWGGHLTMETFCTRKGNWVKVTRIGSFQTNLAVS